MSGEKIPEEIQLSGVGTWQPYSPSRSFDQYPSSTNATAGTPDASSQSLGPQSRFMSGEKGTKGDPAQRSGDMATKL
jgi:hypothetical protein